MVHLPSPHPQVKKKCVQKHNKDLTGGLQSPLCSLLCHLCPCSERWLASVFQYCRPCSAPRAPCGSSRRRLTGLPLSQNSHFDNTAVKYVFSKYL